MKKILTGVFLCVAITCQASVRVNETSQKCLSEALFYETNGEPLMGQIAVGIVILNRVNAQVATSVCSVVHQRVGKHWQFGYNERKVHSIPLSRRQYFYGLAEKILSGETGNFHFPPNILYFNNHSFDKKKYRLFQTIGHQKFYYRVKY